MRKLEEQMKTLGSASWLSSPTLLQFISGPGEVANDYNALESIHAPRGQFWKLEVLFIRSPDSPNGLQRTLGKLGIPHGHPVAKRSSPKTHRIVRNRKSTLKNTSSRVPKKNTKSKAFPRICEGGSPGKESLGTQVWIPQQERKENSSDSSPRKSKEKVSKITEIGKTWERWNNVESSIHHKRSIQD